MEGGQIRHWCRVRQGELRNCADICAVLREEMFDSECCECRTGLLVMTKHRALGLRGDT